jgi:hypothetical protein
LAEQLINALLIAGGKSRKNSRIKRWNCAFQPARDVIEPPGRVNFDMFYRDCFLFDFYICRKSRRRAYNQRNKASQTRSLLEVASD